MPAASLSSFCSVLVCGSNLSLNQNPKSSLTFLWRLANRYMGLDGGGFTNIGGLDASALKLPKLGKPKKAKKKKEEEEEEEEPESIGDKAGKMFVKGLNKGINSGLGMIGAE